jgi:hypothetical protein
MLRTEGRTQRCCSRCRTLGSRTSREEMVKVGSPPASQQEARLASASASLSALQGGCWVQLPPNQQLPLDVAPCPVILEKVSKCSGCTSNFILPVQALLSTLAEIEYLQIPKHIDKSRAQCLIGKAGWLALVGRSGSHHGRLQQQKRGIKGRNRI